ncbi:2'-deoxynucleoside 5'-phosphate N-hydrolase 1-like [Dreissena polymorpha]|uniref:2'-deoxynucleoside 5'-phosphate N-hydrolase 1-like n=1 Tax=Dreissena polymorpha TaxID=45954 RepID=UPI002264A143|nr:2'-deoxynucleoside 5'-phosphate N-hydrolase 1-like [Dreissena polymorpha]XP_052214882.1 2'-deoxynucleoside 5'-phosphate N-hydrolase 1-like [Dreissena polymorpha]XP_052214883.1 2'-deoxynucleoside 5'-phosphate N-hydrolase 1-like [Dreissena polymorpha]
MKIFFGGSMRGGRQDAEIYERLIEKLQTYGEVLTDHVGSKDVEKNETDATDKCIYDRVVRWLEESDVVVAEVTQTSIGVGYEIGRAVAMGKKILCLCRPSPDKRLSAMIAGAHNGTTFVVKNYTEEEAEQIFKDFLT